MIKAVRATHTALTQLDLYMNGDVSLKLSEDDVTVLCMVPTPGAWVPMNMLRERMRADDMHVKDLVISITSLRDRHLLDVFQEITDATYLFCHIGQWRFQQQWTVFRKQVKFPDEKEHAQLLGQVAQDLYDRAEAFVPGDPPMKVTLV